MPKLLNKNKNLEFLYEYEPLITAGLIQSPVLVIIGKIARRVPYTDAFNWQMQIKQMVTVMLK